MWPPAPARAPLAAPATSRRHIAAVPHRAPAQPPRRTLAAADEDAPPRSAAAARQVAKPESGPRQSQYGEKRISQYSEKRVSHHRDSMERQRPSPPAAANSRGDLMDDDALPPPRLRPRQARLAAGRHPRVGDARAGAAAAVAAEAQARRRRAAVRLLLTHTAWRRAAGRVLSTVGTNYAMYHDAICASYFRPAAAPAAVSGALPALRRRGTAGQADACERAAQRCPAPCVTLTRSRPAETLSRGVPARASCACGRRRGRRARGSAWR